MGRFTYWMRNMEDQALVASLSLRKSAMPVGVIQQWVFFFRHSILSRACYFAIPA